MGMISVVFVEVPAGSTMFPFWTIWGVLVVIPLYLLHSVFLAGVVFRFGKPLFWPLFAAGMLYGMYEAYITKVLWTSFRPEGPFYRLGGIALFETILLVFFLHPILAFVVPLFFTEVLCTNSSEVAEGLPRRVQNSLRTKPRIWIGGLMAFLGLMQFINSPSVAASLLSGAGNSLVLALALFWWRRSGGAAYSMRELLPGTRGLKVLAAVLLVWYVFWGFAIKPKSIPGLLDGQLTILILYVVIFLVFLGCLRKSRLAAATPPGTLAPLIIFRWRGFISACVVATAVTTISRLLLIRFAWLQVVVLFTFYVVAGLLLFAGAVLDVRPNRVQPVAAGGTPG
jgi:hypothetical protein